MTIIKTNKVLQPRREADFYPTPLPLCRDAVGLAIEKMGGRTILTALDPGAGNGNWGIAIQEAFRGCIWLEGNDVRDLPQPPSYHRWQPGFDFTNQAAIHKTYNDAEFDIIVGNPPYKHAESFVWNAYSLLAPNGILVFLLRLSFLESKRRGRDLFDDNPPHSVHVLMERISFYENGRSDDTAYALYFWKKTTARLTTHLYWTSWR